MLIKVKSAVSWMRARLSAISLADIQKHLAKIIILTPMAVLLIYLAIFSQPRYMSESKVAIKRSDDLNSGSLNFGLLLGASNPSSAEDALYLKEYINSPDMLAALDKQLNFREAFSHSGLDFLNHLSKDETAEGFLKYYKDRINVSYDDKTGLLNIQTQGFSPEFALKFNQTVLKESERFINEMSHPSRVTSLPLQKRRWKRHASVWTPAKRNCSLIKTTTTFWIHRHRHRRRAR